MMLHWRKTSQSSTNQQTAGWRNGRGTWLGTQTTVYLVACLVFSALVSPASAIEAIRGEKAKLKACEKQLCQAILSKSPKGKPIACKLIKTWDRNKIKKGAGTKSLKWGFGDAQCTIDLKLDRSLIASAMTAPKYKLFLPQHTVNCRVETEDGVKPVRVVLAPKIKFKNGRAYKAWLKVKDVQGPGMLEGLIWTTVRLEDSIGIFHGQIIKAVNKFTQQQCVERYATPKKTAKKKIVKK